MTDALKKVRGALEAVLFTMGQAVSMDTLKMALDCDEETVKAALDELRTRGEACGSCSWRTPISSARSRTIMMRS